MASQKLYHPGMKSNLRLTVRVNRGPRDTFHYDVGVAKIEDPQNRLSQYNHDIHPVEPRFLEDYIGVYGKDNISIHEWGKYADMEVVEHDKRCPSIADCFCAPKVLRPQAIVENLLS